MKFSAIVFALPIILSSWTVMAEPILRQPHFHGIQARDEDIARLTARRLQARHDAEWEVFARDFDPLVARRSCKSSRDCLGMICINGSCQ